MKNENDLRVIKTRSNIMHAFLSLLEKKALEEITVAEICRLAHCSRNTFYLHYAYKEAVYEQLVNECIEDIRNGIPYIDPEPGESDEDYARRSMRYMSQAVISVKDKLRPIMAGDSSNLFFYKLMDVIRDLMHYGGVNMWGKESHDDKAYKLMCGYSAGAMVGALLCCYHDDEICLEEAMQVLTEMHVPPFVVSTKYMREKYRRNS